MRSTLSKAYNLPSPVVHAHFLLLMEQCRTPGTTKYARIEFAVACMNNEKEWKRPRYIPRYLHHRTKLEVFRQAIQHYRENGGKFTYVDIRERIRFAFSRCSVVETLKCHSKELGIRVLRHHDRRRNLLTVWEVIR